MRSGAFDAITRVPLVEFGSAGTVDDDMLGSGSASGYAGGGGR